MFNILNYFIHEMTLMFLLNNWLQLGSRNLRFKKKYDTKVIEFIVSPGSCQNCIQILQLAPN